MTETVALVINLSFLVLFGIVGFFLKRTILTMYDHITACNAKHIDLATIQNEVKNMKELFASELRHIRELVERGQQEKPEYRKPGR
jgi:sensor histidine kinase YesM